MTIIAGRRWGKSRAGSIAGADEAMIPNSIGWACAPTNDKLHRYVIPAFEQLIPKDFVADWSIEHKDLLLKNGSLIHFQTLEDPDQGRGQGLDWLWIDEVCELTPMHWEVIRPSLAGNTVAFFTTTPRGYDWVYHELYRKAIEGVPGFWACKTRTIDSANPRISKEFLEREKATMSDTMYRQEYEADFVIFEGAVYGGLVDSHILRSDDEIKNIIPEWPAIDSWRDTLIGIDTGADHPFGAVKMVSTEKGMVVVGEYLERHRPFIQHAAELKRLAGRSNVRWAINKNERQQILELAQHGIYCQRAHNDQMAGTERVKSWLQSNQLWFIERLVPRTIDQMKAYRYNQNFSDKTGEKRIKERVFKLNDELPDCIRYALMTWPALPKEHRSDPNAPRDLTKLPDEMRGSIERLRRIEGRDPSDKLTVVGDFWN